MNKFYHATATLIGTIIGAGVFGLPYVVQKSGTVTFVFYMLILTLIVTLLHLLYGEVVLRTNGQHRLVGYAGIYLGVWGKRISSVSVILGSYAALLAYIILGGTFLHVLLGDILGGTAFMYSLIFFIFSAVFIAKGLKMVSRLELFLSFFLMAAILIFLWEGLPFIDVHNFSLNINWPYAFLPYGIILFALSGASAIPDLAAILKDDRKRLRKVIVLGTLIPAVIYFFFALAVFGVSGEKTSQDSISGLMRFYGSGIIKLGAIIGFLAVITSFLSFGINLKKTFEYDYKLSKKASLFFSLSVPFLLFLAGVDNFIGIMSFAGAVGMGMDGMMIIAIYRRADRGQRGDRTPEYDIVTSNWLEYLIMVIFVAGIVYTLSNFAI